MKWKHLFLGLRTPAHEWDEKCALIMISFLVRLGHPDLGTEGMDGH